jgi:hypothetical protein
MDTDRLNRWLTLIANIGVIIGIAFLIVEIDQANRIARYSAENARRSQFMEINSSRIETSALYAKLQAGQTDLSPPERAQAVMMARQLMNTWEDAESAFNFGLLSEYTFELTLRDVSVALDEAPGLLPFFEYLLEVYDYESDPALVPQRVAAEIAKRRTQAKDD